MSEGRTGWGGLINGVPREQYGMWCPHGKRVMVPHPDDAGDYPRTIFAEPWPCDEADCTPERLEAELTREAEEYEQARWDEYRSLVS